jgi:CheY-like chemotaxis protein
MPLHMPNCILVVDDQPSVLGAIEGALEPRGFTVATATSASQALDMCRDASARIDIVLADVMMPGMNGVEFGELLLKLRPATRLVLMSGYSDSEARQLMAKSHAKKILAKPFGVATLLEAISDGATRLPVGSCEDDSF